MRIEISYANPERFVVKECMVPAGAAFTTQDPADLPFDKSGIPERAESITASSADYTSEVTEELFIDDDGALICRIHATRGGGADDYEHKHTVIEPGDAVLPTTPEEPYIVSLVVDGTPMKDLLWKLQNPERDKPRGAF